MKSCPRCGEPSKAAKGGFCSACTAWWYRIQTLTPREAAAYAENFSLRLTRMEGRARTVSRLRRKAS